MGDDRNIAAIELTPEELASFESKETYVAPDPAEQGKNGEQQVPDEKDKSEPDDKGATLPNGEISEPKPDEEELVYEVDGKDYSETDIDEWFEAFTNKDKWQKSNTEKAQGLSEERKTFVDKVKSLKDLVGDKDAMTALDEYYGDESKNPLRGLDLELSKSNPDTSGEESKSEWEKRVETLEERESERIREIEEKETLEKVSKLVDRDISELIELDADMKEPEKQKKVINHAIEWSEKHPEEPPMSLKASWLDTFGLKKLTGKQITDDVIEGNVTVPGNGKGAKTTTYKTQSGTYEEATDRALKQFEEMEG